MQTSNEIQKLLDELGLEYIETVADRRDTLALKVLRDDKRMVLKLSSVGESEESKSKARLLAHEAEILSQIPHLTNRLYVGHGENGGRQWLLIREINGQEVHQVAKRVRETVSDKKEMVAQLMKLLLKVSAFYDALYTGGYLHGDVQAAHTYLEHGEITVIDWGLARKVSEPNPLYKGGFIYFVAPEIAASMRAGKNIIDYTTRAEVYALGATLYMFYVGHLGLDFGIPKENLRQAPMDQKLARVMENRIFSFEEIGAEPYPELETLLRKSLSTDPEQRFENPSVLHQHLSELGSL
jgi:serine/threonine-protein kinase